MTTPAGCWRRWMLFEKIQLTALQFSYFLGIIVIFAIMPVYQPYISEQFKGVIWRLEIDELTDTICIETRDETEKLVSFSSISLNTGQSYFKELSTEERWLTGIETVYDGVLLLHNYLSQNGPLHKGIIAIDAVTGDTLWSNYTLAFEVLTNEGPILYDTHIHPKRLYLADVHTGATTRVYEPTINTEIKNNIAVPAMTDPSAIALPLPPFGNSVHYLEYNNRRIVSLHTIQAGTLQQWLFVMKSDGKVYEDLLNTGIQKLQPESFILHKDRLIYIKNRSELKIIKL